MVAKLHRFLVQSAPKKPRASFSSQFFSVKVFSSTLLYPRFGVVVGKSFAKKAVARNKMKRSIYSFCRRETPRFPIADFLIIPRASAITLTNREVDAELMKLIFR